MANGVIVFFIYFVSSLGTICYTSDLMEKIIPSPLFFRHLLFVTGGRNFRSNLRNVPSLNHMLFRSYFLSYVHGYSPSDGLKTKFHPMRMVQGPNLIYHSQFPHFKLNCYMSSKLESGCVISIQASHLKNHAPKLITGTSMTSKSIIIYKSLPFSNSDPDFHFKLMS